jgi:ABC-type Mn2+/Zn2+ transport system ATPase subunit
MGLVGMIDFANRPIGKLSGGEFQKILLARAFAQKPKILLLDEPYSNLDYSARKQIETLLNRYHKEHNITIIIVSHDISFVPSRCKRIIVMENGKIKMDGKKDDILTSDKIKKIYYKKRERIND